MPYVGQNILHMMIIRRNYDEVRWMLDFFKDHQDSVPNGLKLLLIANATGQFFDRDGDFYFGGYPLQFAVCSNSTEIFDLVLSFASSLESDANECDDGEETSIGPNVIFMRDAYGNTVLHLCVMHCLKEMFDHVYNTAETIISRNLKIMYAKHRESSGHHPHHQNESNSRIVTGYQIRPRKVQYPTDIREYEEWLISGAKTKLNERLLLVLNNDLHSLITLASVIKKEESSQKMTKKLNMLKYLLQKLKSVCWTYGKVQCLEFDLAGLEVKYDLSEYVIEDKETLPPHNSAISWLCIHDIENAMMIPEIRRVIETKWERCGLIYCLKSFILDAVIVILLTVILVYGNYTPTLSTKYISDWFVNIIYSLIVVIFAVLIVIEMWNIVRFKSVFRNARGLAYFHITCRLVEMISFAIFSSNKYAKIRAGQIDKCNYYSTGLHPQNIIEIKVPLIICVMTSWLHLYYYVLAFQSAGLFVITMTKIVVRDIPHFFRFYTISLFAFTSAISVLSNTGNYHTRIAFWRYIKTIWTLIHATVNTSSPDDQSSLTLVAKDLQWLSDIWSTLFYYVVAYVMLNLLIAIINSTYRFYTTYNDETKGFNNEAILLMEKFNVMDYLEQHLSPVELHEFRDKYAMIKVNNSSLSDSDAINSNQKKKSCLSKFTSLLSSSSLREDKPHQTPHSNPPYDSLPCNENAQMDSPTIQQQIFSTISPFCLPTSPNSENPSPPPSYKYFFQVHDVLPMVVKNEEANLSKQ